MKKRIILRFLSQNYSLVGGMIRERSLKITNGGIPKRPTGTDCKSVVL